MMRRSKSDAWDDKKIKKEEEQQAESDYNDD